MGNINTYKANDEAVVIDQSKPVRKVRNPYATPVLAEYSKVEEQVTINKQVKFATEWNTDEEWIRQKNTDKVKGMMRIWLQNLNGIKAGNDFRIFRSELEDVNSYEIDFLVLSESTLNNNNQFVRSRLKMLVDYHSPNAKMCITNTGGYDKETCYQPGGVQALVMGKLAGRYAGSGHDKLGRYSWTTFCGKKVIENIYILSCMAGLWKPYWRLHSICATI